MIDQITLTARIVDPLHFVFVPEKWTKELKPVSKARWTHGHGHANKTAFYSIKEGDLLAFPQFHLLNGGFYAAHVYAVVKEFNCAQIHATITTEGLTLESVGGDIKTRVTLKPHGLSRNDTAHHVILQ